MHLDGLSICVFFSVTFCVLFEHARGDSAACFSHNGVVYSDTRVGSMWLLLQNSARPMWWLGQIGGALLHYEELPKYFAWNTKMKQHDSSCSLQHVFLLHTDFAKLYGSCNKAFGQDVTTKSKFPTFALFSESVKVEWLTNFYVDDFRFWQSQLEKT